MIAVIADDFTGAAEMAGIALRYGIHLPVVFLKEKVQLNDPGPATGCIICTDSRSLNEKDAADITVRAVRILMNFKPTLLFKKIDSVLRGHVLTELREQMRITGAKRALIVPANPSLGRTINSGNYLIAGTPIAETSFAHDPEFPVTSSSVNKILRDENIIVQKADEPVTGIGIIVAETSSVEDVDDWARIADPLWALAGAGDFFNALLAKQYSKSNTAATEMLSPHLYICGTAFPQRRNWVKKVEAEHGCVAWLPRELQQEWKRHTLAVLEKQQRLILAIDEPTGTASETRNAMAAIAKQLIEESGVKEIFIEGGATAASLLSELVIGELVPVNELQRGVVRMQSNEYFITVKPGSYQLPPVIEEIYS